MNDFIAAPLSKVQILRLTQKIRSLLNLQNDLFFDVVRFVEFFLQEFIPGFTYEYVDQSDLPPGTYAYYDPVNKLMRISIAVYEGAIRGNGRDRFTIAHEIGHCLLHSNELLLCRNIENRPLQAFENPEWQANTFASFLLMPPDLIQNLPESVISDRCKTSYQAACIAKEKSRALN